jgi:hypothetical protein
MFPNAKLSEQLALVGVINPQLVDDNTVTTGWIAAKNFKRFLATILVGATDIGITAKLERATSSGGANAEDITGKAITALIATDDNKQVEIDLRADELTENFTHFRLSITVGNGSVGGYVAATVVAGGLRYGPVADNDLTSVAQIV